MPRTKSIQGPPGALDWAGALGGQGPRYQRVIRFLERAISDGQLRPGDRLPPQRQLAEQLKLDLTTVTRAYAEARARDLIHARGTLGTFVSMPKVELSPVIDLSMNIPPPPAGIDFTDLLKRGLAQVLTYTDADKLMNYQPSGGGKAERAAGAQWLAPMLGQVNPARIAVTPGAQAALAGLILALTKPGDNILTEAMTYPGLLSASRELGRTLKVVESDEHGMTPDALERVCRDHQASIVYLNPTLQNPTTTTMPEGRRRDIARVAEKHDLQIIEDDPYWLLAEDAPSPLVHWAADRVHYIATLSKCLSPGLRTAYVVSPNDAAQGDLLAALRAITLMSTPLATSVATQWIYDGTAGNILEGVKAEAIARQKLAEQIFRGTERRWPRTAIHMWIELTDVWTPQELAIAARMESLAVTSSDAFSAGASNARAIRVSLGGVKERHYLERALRKLAGLLERKSTPFDRFLI